MSKTPNKKQNINWNLKHAGIAAIVFFIISSPVLYQITQAIFGALFKVSAANGGPTFLGLILHTVVYFLVLFGLWFIKGLH